VGVGLGTLTAAAKETLGIFMKECTIDISMVFIVACPLIHWIDRQTVFGGGVGRAAE
jgi:hypothetical protein